MGKSRGAHPGSVTTVRIGKPDNSIMLENVTSIREARKTKDANVGNSGNYPASVVG